MIKVLVIDNSHYITGAAKSIRTLTGAISDRFSFYWAITKDISDEDLRDLGSSTRNNRFDFIEISKSPIALILYLPQLFLNARKIDRLVRKENIEIVHVNDCYNMIGVVLKLLNKRVKVVYHVRLLKTSYIGRLFRSYIRLIDAFADAIICCSKAVSSDVGNVSIEKVVIYDSERFSINDPAEKPINEPVRSIVYVGNVMPGKGQDLALLAFTRVCDHFPDAVLSFIGKYGFNEISSRFKLKLDQMVRDADLQQRVVFRGFEADIEGELKNADVALNLSESESFSMVCLEALKAGLPLIASNCGGPSELFEHMRSGWLVPNQDVPAAAEALRVLLADAKMRASFSSEGKRYVARNFDVSKNGEKLDRLYDLLLA